MKASLEAVAVAAGLRWGGAILFLGLVQLRQPVLRLELSANDKLGVSPGFHASRTIGDVPTGTAYGDTPEEVFSELAPTICSSNLACAEAPAPRLRNDARAKNRGDVGILVPSPPLIIRCACLLSHAHSKKQSRSLRLGPNALWAWSIHSQCDFRRLGPLRQAMSGKFKNEIRAPPTLEIRFVRA